MPLWPLLGSAFAKTTKSPASLELEIQAFWPSMTQSEMLEDWDLALEILDQILKEDDSNSQAR